MDTLHPVEHLFARLDQFHDYPPGVKRMPGRFKGTAFFPGGAGLWQAVPGQPLPPFPVGGVMVLGHNFGPEVDFVPQADELRSENLNGATWRGVRDVLPRAGIPLERCFFTNAYVGVLPGSKAVGRFPGASVPAFVQWCQAFILEQVRAQQPRLLLTLGKEVLPVVAELTPELRRAWSGAKTLRDIDQLKVALVHPVEFPGVSHATAVVALTHPANRPPNVKRRRYQGQGGDAAEMLLLHDALVATSWQLTTAASGSR
jgi:hypothetical protein